MVWTVVGVLRYVCPGTANEFVFLIILRYDADLCFLSKFMAQTWTRWGLNLTSISEPDEATCPYLPAIHKPF